MRNTAIVITGPTASGKSALAVEVARMLGTEVISADSRQIYRGIPIVTAVPSEQEMGGIRHHLIETLPLDAYYSASLFEEQALALARDIISRCGSVVVCGGSMMYVDAFCNSIDTIPTVPDSVRRGLEAEVAEKGEEWLLGELARLDPEYFSIVDRKNVKRVFHAVEIIRTAGVTFTSLRQGIRRKRDFEIRKFALTMPREQLFGRINSRVDRMVGAGLEEEARNVLPLRHLNSLNTVGLKEMFAMFDGVMDRPTAIERIKKNTRVYAKKQLTWLARDKDLIWLDAPDTLLRSLSSLI